jgi:hypothetical protein
VAILASFFAQQPAAPQEASLGACDPALIGTPVKTIKASKLAAQLNELAAPKDEFETTAAYETRLAKASQAFASEQVLDMEAGLYDSPTRYGGWVKYDADRGALTVDSYLLVAPLRESPWVPDFPKFVGVFLVQQDGKSLGEYSASNAFGATFTVNRYAAKHYYVADPAWTPGTDRALLQGPPTDLTGTYLEIPMAPERAKVLREKMRFALVATPQAPFVGVHTEHQYPKVNQPLDGDTTNHVIVADINCALALDEKGKLLAVWPGA